MLAPRPLPTATLGDDDPVVRADVLTRRYGETLAVDELTTTVRRGSITGLIGPNGAGKTTTLEMLAGLRAPTSGSLQVLGVAPSASRDLLRRHLALQPQHAELLPNQTVHETMALWAALHPDAADVGALQDALGLGGARSTRVDDLSGGQARRLLIATTLVGRPALVLLDEPTTGLDPNARAALWRVVRDYRDAGATIVLSTHSMEEAEAHADTILVMDRGRLVDHGSPAELVARHAPETVVRMGTRHHDVPPGVEDLEGVTSVRRTITDAVIETSRPALVARRLLDLDPPPDLAIRSAGLDRVFERLVTPVEGTSTDDEAPHAPPTSPDPDAGHLVGDGSGRRAVDTGSRR